MITVYILSCLIAWPILARALCWEQIRSQSFPHPLDTDDLVFNSFMGLWMCCAWPLLLVACGLCVAFQWLARHLIPFLRSTVFRGIETQD